MSDTPRTDNAVRFAISRGMMLAPLAEFARELERENAALREAAVEVCILARVWVTVWGDKLSTESIQRFVELEIQILKEAQP